MKHRKAWGFAAAAIIAVAALCSMGSIRRETEPPTSERASNRNLANVTGSNAPATRAPEPAARGDAMGGHDAPLPASLQGTEVDGGLFVDAEGHFVPTPDALALFDYFLAASGEEPLAQLRERIVNQIRSSTEAPATAEAIALLDTYLGFREALRELAEAGTAPPDLERRLQWIRELRRSHFGADTAEVLFSEEEAMLAIDLERRRVNLDPDIDEAERAARLEALEADLPLDVREARRAARAPTQSYQQTEALRSAGASESEIFAAREAEFDTETAERLAEIDAQRAIWQSRLDDYLQARDDLLDETVERTPGEREAAVDALRIERFNENERRRIRALEGTIPMTDQAHAG